MAGFEPAGAARPLVVSTDAVSATHPHLQNCSGQGEIRTPERQGELGYGQPALTTCIPAQNVSRRRRESNPQAPFGVHGFQDRLSRQSRAPPIFSWEGGIRTPGNWHINSVLAYHLPTTQYVVRNR